MIIRFILTSAFILNFIIVSAQTGYFLTDSSSVSGVRLKDGGRKFNSEFCQVIEGEKIIKYSPYQIAGYGFKSGRNYIAKDIHLSDANKRVFLEQLVKGNTVLYSFKAKGQNLFFLEKDSASLIELSKEELTKQLSEITSDCSNMGDASKLVRYKEKSLSKFVSNYNSCELNPFPFIKYGVFFGVIQSRPIVGSTISDTFEPALTSTKFKPYTSAYYGFFLDAPISASYFSTKISLGFYQSSFSSNVTEGNSSTDIILNQSTLRAPVLLRYTFPSMKVRPYVDMGVVYSYNVINDSYMYKSTIENNVVVFEEKETLNVVSDSQLGYSVGFGLQYFLSYKRMVFIEARLNQDYSIPMKDMLNRRAVEFTTGINF
jgi:hypothetical protein